MIFRFELTERIPPIGEPMRELKNGRWVVVGHVVKKEKRGRYVWVTVR